MSLVLSSRRPTTPPPSAPPPLTDASLLPPFISSFLRGTDETITIHVVHHPHPPATSPKPLLLLLHGFPECWYSWRHIMRAFADDYHVAAMDLRGYNLSSKPRGFWWYTAPKVAADVAAVVEQLGGVYPHHLYILYRTYIEPSIPKPISSISIHVYNHSSLPGYPYPHPHPHPHPVGYSTVHLVGHDWGAAVAWTVAERYPFLVGSLVVLSVPHPASFFRNMTWLQALKSSYMLLFQVPVVPEALLTWRRCEAVAAGFRPGSYMGLRHDPQGHHHAGGSHMSHMFMSEHDLTVLRTAMGRPGAMGAALNYYRAMAWSALLGIVGYRLDPPPPSAQTDIKPPGSTPRSSIMARVLVPTMLMYGSEDGALGRDLMRHQQRYAPRVVVHEVANCSHWMMQDRPDEVVRLMRVFYRSTATEMEKGVKTGTGTETETVKMQVQVQVQEEKKEGEGGGGRRFPSTTTAATPSTTTTTTTSPTAASPFASPWRPPVDDAGETSGGGASLVDVAASAAEATPTASPVRSPPLRLGPEQREALRASPDPRAFVRELAAREMQTRH